MQYLLDMEGWADQFAHIDARLRDYFIGFPPRYLILDPVSQLVMGLLGGQTYGHVSKAAHRALLHRYGNWAHVRDAGVDPVRHLIAPVTYAEDKAKNLIATLETISAKSGAHRWTGWMLYRSSRRIDSCKNYPVWGRKLRRLF